MVSMKMKVARRFLASATILMTRPVLCVIHVTLCAGRYKVGLTVVCGSQAIL